MNGIRVIPPFEALAPTHEVLFADLGLTDMPSASYNVDLLSEEGIGFDIDWDNLTAQGFTIINLAGNTTVRGTAIHYGEILPISETVTPLSVNTTRSMMRAMVRRESGVNVPQNYIPPMTDLIVNEVIHDAITRVRMKGGKLMDTKFFTNIGVDSVVESETETFFNLSALSINDVNRLKARYSGGIIPILPDGEYNTHIALRSAQSLRNAVFGKIGNAAETLALSLIVRRGSNISSIATVDISYSRNPLRAATDATKIDLPDEFIPMATTIAAFILKGIVDGTPIGQVDQLIDSYLRTAFAQLGIQVSPAIN